MTTTNQKKNSGNNKLHVTLEDYKKSLQCPPNIVEQAKSLPLEQARYKQRAKRARRDAKPQPPLSVDKVFADFKLGTKFHREGDPDNYYFELRRKVNPGFSEEVLASAEKYKRIEAPRRPDALKGTLYLLNRQTGEEIFHYTVPPAFNII
jgi:hypothetical protein